MDPCWSRCLWNDESFKFAVSTFYTCVKRLKFYSEQHKPNDTRTRLLPYSSSAATRTIATGMEISPSLVFKINIAPNSPNFLPNSSKLHVNRLLIQLNTTILQSISIFHKSSDKLVTKNNIDWLELRFMNHSHVPTPNSGIKVKQKNQSAKGPDFYTTAIKDMKLQAQFLTKTKL